MLIVGLSEERSVAFTALSPPLGTGTVILLTSCYYQDILEYDYPPPPNSGFFVLVI